MGKAIFQIWCNKCYKIIHQAELEVEVDDNGCPTKTERNRVFKSAEFKTPKKCPCCKSKKFKKSFGYKPLKEINDDLPF